MRLRLFAAVAGMLALAAMVCAPSAGATSPGFRGAGYVLTGPNEVSVSFRMPTFTCNAQPDGGTVELGAFSSGSGTGWDVGVVVDCYGGRFTAALQTRYGDFGRGFSEGTVGDPGQLIEITISALHTSAPLLRIRDAGLRHAALQQNLGAPASRLAVGALSAYPPKFTSYTTRVTVNSGRPFTSVPHPRHNDDRHLVTKIKTGAPSDGGTQFALYFRHH